MAQPLDAAEGLVADLATFSLGKVREKGANTGVQRHYAITAWGLDVALRRVRNYEPVLATLLHQPAFLLLRWDGLGHPQRSQDRVVNAVLGNSVVGNVAGLTRVLPATETQLREILV